MLFVSFFSTVAPHSLCALLHLYMHRNTIHQLTEDDEDMALMNLTLLQRKPTLY